jgi:cytochrome oxidase assembly protein ShyY1
LTLLVVVLGITMIELGMWQLRRSHERAAANAVVETNTALPPAPLSTLIDGDEPVDESVEWRTVTVSGTYDESGQTLVRNQSYDGVNGYDVLTPIRPPTGPALLIDRGWVPSGETASAAPDVPPPPSGVVTVQARLRASEPASARTTAGLPPGQVRSFAAGAVGATLAYPIYDAYAEALPGQPGVGAGDEPPRARQLPELSGGPHLAYAVQWFLFTGVAIFGWFVLLRNESRDGRPQAASRSPELTAAPR